MNIRPIANDEETLQQVKRLVDYAENHPLTTSQIQAIGEGRAPPPGDDPNYRCIIGHGYVCTFTIDQGTHRVTGETVWVRHLSVSVIGEKKDCPNEFALNFIMEMFQFRERLFDETFQRKKDAQLMIWLENEDEPDKPTAVNVVESYEKV